MILHNWFEIYNLDIHIVKYIIPFNSFKFKCQYMADFFLTDHLAHLNLFPLNSFQFGHPQYQTLSFKWMIGKAL